MCSKLYDFFPVAPSVINYCNGLEIAVIAGPSYVPKLIDPCSLCKRTHENTTIF